MKLLLLFIFAATALLLAAAPVVYGDEGMWLFNNPPRDYLKKKYDFDATPDWLEHVQKSSVRFNSGGSGSFVSPDGLVMTNHHVGADCLQKFGSKEHNYLRDGFHARTRADERKCDDLELNVLMSIEDVTERVKAAVKPDMKPETAFAARRAIMAEIEKESLDKTGLRSDVITLYQGGQYHLYRFKKYTDVRLVFAPEQQIAFFGGDPDNFEYPRYDLDMCFFRVYENDKPAQDRALSEVEQGRSEGRRIGVRLRPSRPHRPPGDAGRIGLSARYRIPVSLAAAQSLGSAADGVQRPQRGERPSGQGIAVRRAEQPQGARRRPGRPARSAAHGPQEGPGETSCAPRPGKTNRSRRRATPGTASPRPKRSAPRTFTSTPCSKRGAGFNSELFVLARTLLRAAEEKAKPNSKRLREFRESNLESLELQLFSEAPIYDNYEKVKLTDGLTFLANELGADHPLVKKVLAGKSPSERAYELVSGTKVKQVVVRKKLYKGGKEAIDAINDPMIELAQLVDPEARKVRKTVESEVEEVQRQAYARDRQGQVRPGGHQHLSRRDLHPAAGVRTGQGLRGGRQASPLRDDLRRHVQARGGPPQPRTVRPAEALDEQKGQTQSQNAVQLRLHRRHHRRQLRQSGHQPAGRGGRPDLRRQHSVAGCWISPTATSRPAPCRSTRRASSRRCARSTRPTNWPTS